MAKIIKTNGDEIEVTPKNGIDFSLKELQDIVGGYAEIVWLPKDKMMIVNEEGKLMNLAMNSKATQIYQDNFGAVDFIVGDVLLCDKSQVK